MSAAPAALFAPGCIRLDRVTVRYAGRTVLDQVSLEVAPGELVGLSGPPGSGKTTLLKVAAGLMRPDDGCAWLGTAEVSALWGAALDEVHLAVGMAFQNIALFDDKNAQENVALPLLRRGVPREEALARAAEELARVGLGAALSRMPQELSGGMRRRVGLARALVARPPFRFFDDPTAGLDPVASARVLRLVRGVHGEAAGLAAAAEPDALARACDRMLLLEDGRLSW